MTNTQEMLARLNAFRAIDGKAPIAKWKNARHASQLDAYINGAPAVADVTPIVEIVTQPTIETIAPVAVVKPATKKQQLRAFIMQQAVSINDIATHFAISMAAARSLIGDIQREGDKLVVEKVEGFRAGFYRFA